jgi:enediyne biosynthesis protein E4
VHANGLAQVHDLVPVVGYLSQGDPRPHFGLDTATEAEKVEIRWPNGQMTTLEHVPANQMLTVIQDAN